MYIQSIRVRGFTDEASEDRFIMDMDHYHFGVSLHSAAYQSVLDLMTVLAKLDVIDMQPDDEDIYQVLTAQIFKRKR